MVFRSKNLKTKIDRREGVGTARRPISGDNQGYRHGHPKMTATLQPTPAKHRCLKIMTRVCLRGGNHLGSL